MSEVDYGYGSDNEDYGYGDASAPEEDYGYGEPEEYGYEDTEEEPVVTVKAAEPVEEKFRPKRRCSVTKFNLDNSEALTAADRIREMRNNDNNNTPPVVKSSDDGFQTDDMSSDDTDAPVVEKSSSKDKKKLSFKKNKGAPPKVVAPKVAPKGALSRLRKRLSIAFSTD